MNIDKIRQDTIGCTNKIFLNSAGASLMPRIVLEKVKWYLDEESMSGGYYTQDQYSRENNAQKLALTVPRLA